MEKPALAAGFFVDVPPNRPAGARSAACRRWCFALRVFAAVRRRYRALRALVHFLCLPKENEPQTRRERV
jgi:hypothetical protein